jgi:hypothetical protein
MNTPNKREKYMSTFIRVAILSWSAALLTASYAGLLAKMDPTFIATVFTASAATFGINTMKKGGDDDDEKKSEAKTEEFVETPPTSDTESVAAEASAAVEKVVVKEVNEEPLVQTAYKEESSLEERVEALEAKVDEEKPYSRGDL